jgi:microcystin-dependent protein
MATPYLGEIDYFAFGFAPKNWAICAGQLLPIQQNQALFSLLGTTYGGDGIRTFQLPDLRGRVAIGQGQGQGLSDRVLGEVTGQETHTIIPTEIPPHTHLVNAIKANGTSVTVPVNNVLSVGSGTGPGGSGPVNIYDVGAANAVMATNAIAPSPGAAAHSNMMPYLAILPCIALSGAFPSRN